jgi:hypothetical protein
MDYDFDDAGDLGFYDLKDEVIEPDDLDDELFDSPLPGDDAN